MQVLCAFFVAIFSASIVAQLVPEQRIVGGWDANIKNYPYAVAFLYSSNLMDFTQDCGGTIITSTAILSAALCTYYRRNVERIRARVGSNFASNGGTVYDLRTIIRHPDFNIMTLDNDISVLRTRNSIVYSSTVQPARIAGNTYQLVDNLIVWGVGWGRYGNTSPLSDHLRHVQMWTVNQHTCRSQYADTRQDVTDNMVCVGNLDGVGRGQCEGDNGGPLIHNGVVVGVYTWTEQCGSPLYPSLNTRVSHYIDFLHNSVA